MERLVVNWLSNANVLLLNPRLGEELKLKVQKAWDQVQSQFQGHVGLLTSGSSGSSKLVLLSKSALLAAAEGANAHLASGRSDTWLKTLPEFHVGGLSIYARAYLSGAKVVESSSWNPEEIYNLAVREKVTLVSLVPTQLYDFVSAKMPAPPTLRAVIIGGGALGTDLYDAARNLSWPVLPSYGLTECGSQVATALPETLASNDSSLILLPHIEADISENKKLKIKSKALLTAYVDLGTLKIRDPKIDGYFETEDFAELAERILKVQGRTQDFLKIGGESVDFAALQKTFEQIFREKRTAGDAVILSVPDERLGFIIVLLASGMSDAQRESLMEAFNSKVMPYERIRQSKTIGQIPRSELGKLLRAQAIERYLHLS